MMPTNPITESMLEQAIIFNPLIVKSDVLLAEAIVLMSAARATCCLLDDSGVEKNLLQTNARASCLLVMEENRLVGILTERDIVRLSADGQPFTNRTVAEVMTRSVITLPKFEFTNIFAALHLLQRHQIRHLPLFDDQGQVIGLLTHETLRQLLRPVDLLRLRLVSETMISEVIAAAPETSVLEIARLMTKHRVSSVVIVETQEATTELVLVPVGIITEGDIVQFQALNLDFNQIQAQRVMSTPLFAVHPSDSLWTVKSLMQEKRLSRVVVTGDADELLGIVTQSTLLQTLNPLEMYNLVEVLEKKVCHLQAEKVELLAKRNVELDLQVQQRTAELRKKTEREKLLSVIATRIRASLELPKILDTVVTEVQQFLQCDRVLVYQFNQDWSGTVTAEAVLPGWRSALGNTIADCCFPDKAHQVYAEGKKQSVSNIYQVGYPDCHIQLLESYQVKANLVVPILVEQQLWGLLIGHQCESDRIWESTDLEFLDRIAVQVAIAIQQSHAYEKAQQEITERRQVETALKKSEATNRAIIQGIPDSLIRMNSRGEYQDFLSGEAAKVIQPQRNTRRASVWDFLPEHLATQRLHYTNLALTSGQLQVYEQQIEIGGKSFEEEIRITPLNEEEVLVIIRDITDRKQAEAAFQSLVEGVAAIAGENFFAELTQYIATTLQVRNVMISKQQGDRMESYGFWADGQLQPNTTYPCDGTPCALTMQFGKYSCLFGLQEQFPDNSALKVLKAESYIGVVLKDTEGVTIGSLCVMDDRPFTNERLLVDMLRVFAVRVSSELERQRAIDALKQLNEELEDRIARRTIELRQSEEQFRHIFEQSPVGIAISDLEGQVNRANSSLMQITGYSKAALLQKSIMDLLSPDGQQQVIQQLKQLLEKTLAITTFETELVSAQGQTIWVNVTSALILNAFGRPSGMIHLIEDVSQRKQAQAELIDLTTLQQAILNSTDYSIISTDSTGIIHTFNVAAQRMLGYTAQEVVRKLTPELIHDRAEVHKRATVLSEEKGRLIEPGFEVFVAKARQGISTEEQWTYIRKDGSRVPVLLSVSALRDPQGQITGFLGIAKDICRQKQAEEKLHQTLQELSDFKYALDEAAIVAITDATGVITYANQRFCEISKYSREELIGTSHRLVNSDFHPKQFFTQMWNRISQGEPWRREIQNRAKDGTYYWVDTTIVPFLDHQGKPIQYLAISTDISSRKQAEFQAESLNNRLQFILSSSPAVIYTCRTSGNYSATSVSQNVTTLLGYEPSELLGEFNPWLKLIHPEEKSKTVSEFSTVFEQGHKVLEYRVLHKNGIYRWIRDEMRLIYNSQGNPVEVIGSVTDITDRKQMELELEELTISLQNAMEGISRLDKQGRYVSVNPAYSQPCGYEPEELVGVDWQKTVHPEDIPLMVAAYKTMLERGKVDAEARGIRKDGSLFYKQVTMVTALDRNGQFNGHYCFLKDITDRKLTEEALKRTVSAIEAAIDGIAILKGDTYTYLNKSHTEMFGYTDANDLIGKSWTTLYSPEELSRIQQEVFPVLMQQHFWQGEAIAIRKDGKTFNEGLSLTITERGELICVCRDITEQKQAEAKIRQANDQLLLTNAELARATRLKDEFLANMSHELRTPLNAILGMTEGLQEQVFGDISDRQQQAIQTIERSGKHLLELINDILDLSKIESGKLELQIAPVSISYLCQSSLTFVRQQAIKKNIQLTSEVPQGLSDIAVDERRIRQLLINLLNNAVKFTPERGSVKLVVQTEQQPEQSFLILSVIDTGIGIAPADMSKLFQSFVQIDSSLNRQYAGTGLGLSLVRRLAELHGGVVTVTSEVGRGSCFTVRLPYLTTPRGISTPTLPPINVCSLSSENLRVLIIDDSSASAAQITRYLNEVGMEVFVYSHGSGAIEEVLRINPALIILDIQLPNLSGWTILNQLKIRPRTQNIPVVVVSVLDERSRGLSLGAVEHLVKPITRTQLHSVLEQLRDPQQSQEKPAQHHQTRDALIASESVGSALAPQTSVTQAKSSPKILLAEDNEASVVTISSYLKAKGYRLVLAKNGEEAITLAKTENPDLILMDIQMPKVDGLEAIRQIRALQQFRYIPIVALTALAMPSDQEKCIAAGANEYFPKPVKLKPLVEKIQTLLVET
jgi:PAS domain S-box-containing protein